MDPVAKITVGVLLIAALSSLVAAIAGWVIGEGTGYRRGWDAAECFYTREEPHAGE